jgi:predicted Zn finger-like uncharacterized protein
MQIVCPNCETSYEVEAVDLGVGERQVRCARCRHVWAANVPDAAPAMEMSGAPANAQETFRADPSAGKRGPVPSYEPLRPDGSTGKAPTTVEQRIPAAEWDDEAAEQPAAETGDRPDGGPAPVEDAPPPDPAMAPDDAINLENAPPLAPAITDGTMPDDTPAAAAKTLPVKGLYADIETFAARRAQRVATRRGRIWLKPNLSTGIIIMLVMVSVLIGWRNDVVRMMPQTASLFSAIGLQVNLRGLVFTDVKSTREQHDGVNVLVIEGKIISQVPKPVEVPRLRFAVRNDAGNEVYTWTALPTRSILGPGETLPFRSRLASPPPDTRTVLVRFFNRRDIVHGAR